MNLEALKAEVQAQLNELLADETPDLDLMLADVNLLRIIREIEDSQMHTGSGVQPDPAAKGDC